MEVFQIFLTSTFISAGIVGVFGQPLNCSGSNNVNCNNIENPNGNSNSQLQNLELSYFNLFLSNPYETSPQNENGVPASSAVSLQEFSQPLSALTRLCPRGTFFASYNPSHKSAVSTLNSQYNDRQNMTGFANIAGFFKTRPEVHPKVWYTSLLQAQLRLMPDTMSMRRPSPIELFPTNFFPDRIIQKKSQSAQECLLLDERFGRDNGIENTLWYFREDVQMNAHHWIWHLLYPLNSTNAIERRGEFFYFFHHELIARYTAERLSNNLEPQKELDMKLDTVIDEGYVPHLADGISTRVWAPRVPALNLEATLSEAIYGALANLVRNKNRLLKSLKAGTILDVNGDCLWTMRGAPLPIHKLDRINLLGELSEASNHTINPTFYGTDGYHNAGHWVLANTDGRPEPNNLGVMGDVATAMRDPIFYRWHTFVDNLFLAYKNLYLKPYRLRDGEHPLVMNGVVVRGVSVFSDNTENSANVVRTFWNSRRYNLEGGLDFNSANDSRRVNVNVCSKHLDHEEFQYEINIESQVRNEALAVIRIFMAPRFKLNGETYTLEEQRRLFFVLDTFTTNLRPGNNSVSRRSIDSTVTAPWPQSIEELRREITSGIRGRSDCDCGYPHHLLLPKGTNAGMMFDLFVMVTDGKKDVIFDRIVQTQNMEIPQCTPSHVHCGIQGESYPDAKPMGYPFDRRPFTVSNEGRIRSASNLEEYVQYIPNSATTQITIIHEDIQRGLENYRQLQL